ncbi:TIGR02270 family protein [Uliginosibacterium flavum]|uniref:TIGR02270 family protein n=1 Tax=Uliginosibacterium flavum TaxID=1396831 RepID=A0ABV2THZ4_9RHOO
MKEVHVTEIILAQHTEDAALIYLQRRAAVHAPHFALLYLQRLDERLAAHLDGLCVAAQEGRPWLREEDGDLPGALFAETVVALTEQPSRLDALLSRTALLPDEFQDELIAALGWVDANCLKGTVQHLLASENPFRRRIGLVACTQHRVNPGSILHGAFNAEDPALRACAAHTAAKLGMVEMREHCRTLLSDADPRVSFQAAWGGVLLGERSDCLARLGAWAAQPGPQQTDALRLWLLAAAPTDAHNLLARLRKAPEHIRTLITGSGVVGDPHYLPWLLQQTENPALARLAGEAFTLITGLDLSEADLESEAPPGAASGPDDDPESDDLSDDPDENLPWPDAAKLQAWWQANAADFPAGQPFFMGQPRDTGIALTTLRGGYQRQRRLAALILALHSPDAVLFNIAAPARRQKQLLQWLS